ncbi:tail tape measure protein [Sphingomonas bacterium]|uniref:tail tape measure protein n=1 Tax=Sphingomonas bacterium TaxID=1895847 RepID=UPI00157578AC|nr:tail tape measure protein [Sphingomonas bacterium]
MDDMQDMVVGVRADTAGFARDVAAMRAQLEGPLTAGADKASRAIEANLLRAVQTGKLGFADLEKTALSALDSIASSALKSGLAAIVGTGPGSGGSAGGLLSGLTGLVGGQPGRATGGPVSPGQAYMVGERGPELFVPTAAGQVDAGGGGSARSITVSIAVNARAGEAPAALQQSSRQVARAVKAALQ